MVIFARGVLIPRSRVADAGAARYATIRPGAVAARTIRARFTLRPSFYCVGATDGRAPPFPIGQDVCVKSGIAITGPIGKDVMTYGQNISIAALALAGHADNSNLGQTRYLTAPCRQRVVPPRRRTRGQRTAFRTRLTQQLRLLEPSRVVWRLIHPSTSPEHPSISLPNRMRRQMPERECEDAWHGRDRLS